MYKLFSQFIRFAGIGFLNTAVDFAVLNLFAAMLGAYTGVSVAIVNTISFTIAITHSYLWNKYWAFGSHDKDTGLWKNLGQFISAAVLGAGLILVVLFGASKTFGVVFFLGVILLLAVGELGLWKAFKLRFDPEAKKSGKQLLLFVIISAIGILVNSGIVGGVTGAVEPQFGINQELWTNIIKVLATGISLVWNFVGYKLFVFKK